MCVATNKRPLELGWQDDLKIDLARMKVDEEKIAEMVVLLEEMVGRPENRP